MTASLVRIAFSLDFTKCQFHTKSLDSHLSHFLEANSRKSEAFTFVSAVFHHRQFDEVLHYCGSS